MNRKLDVFAWMDGLQATKPTIKADRSTQIQTLKDAYAHYQATPEEEEAFKMKADDHQIGGAHYKNMAVQPWAVMEAVLTPEEFRGFLKGCIIKYAMRQGLKDSDDAGKCKHYIQKLNEFLQATEDQTNGKS
jgi:hypothetical protein